MRRVAILFTVVAAVVLAAAVAEAHDGYVVYSAGGGDCGCGPVAVAAYYYAPAPAFTYGGPVIVRSRYRPILGGTVTRFIDYGYGPVYAPLWW